MNRTAISMPDLADFLAAKLARSNYRKLEAETGVSHGTLEHIIKRKGKDLPQIETLRSIADAYKKPLWEVVQMVVDLKLPQTPTERSRRFEALIGQLPMLQDLVEDLQDMHQTDPDFVDGMLLGLEGTIAQAKQRRKPSG